MTKPSILIVDDDRDVLATFSYILDSSGFSVHTAVSVDEALKQLESWPCDVAIVDIHLGADTGVDLLRLLKKSNPLLQVVLITGHPQVETASEAVRLGACDYLSKPIHPNELLNAAHHALTCKQLAEQTEAHQADLQAIFSSLSDGILMIDQEGRIQQSNLAYLRICGLFENNLSEAIPDSDLPCAGLCRQTILKALQGGAPQKLERFRCNRQDRQNQVVTITTSPIRNLDGACTGIVAALRDETRIDELEGQLSTRKGFGRIIGTSAPMQKIYTQIEALADLPSTVLIQGESGTGKELVAEALHTTGTRRNRPFIKVNCSALSDTLLESELFGHVKGAFTGAIANRTGRFQKADSGTIFLDEIGDISPAMQMRLLRVLQEREFERVGDSTSIKVDVRVIAATNSDLLERVKQGRFREDLYYRLNVVKMTLPPLRERRDDLSLLVAHFLEKFSTAFSKPVAGVSSEVMQLFMTLDWPGNVRELQHVIEHATILCSSSQVECDDLPQDLFHHSLPTPSPLLQSSALHASTVPMTIQEAITRCNGNKTDAARLLGISRRTLYRHLEHPPAN